MGGNQGRKKGKHLVNLETIANNISRELVHGDTIKSQLNQIQQILTSNKDSVISLLKITFASKFIANTNITLPM